MLIALDHDGCIASFWEVFIPWARSQGDTRPDHIIMMQPRYSSEEIENFMGLYGQAFPVVDGVKESLHEILERIPNTRVHIITAREPAYEGMTISWLNRNAIPFSGITCCSTKTNKVMKAIALGAEWMIDDHPEVVQKSSAAGIKSLLINTRYNTNMPVPATVGRVDWEEVVDWITGDLHDSI